MLRFPDTIADEYTTDYDLAAVTEAVRRHSLVQSLGHSFGHVPSQIFGQSLGHILGHGFGYGLGHGQLKIDFRTMTIGHGPKINFQLSFIIYVIV